MSDRSKETADAISEGLRKEAARADTEQYYTLDDAAESMREFANRLEAALKREREDLELRVTRITREECRAEYCKTVGNAAALRQALEKVRFYLPYFLQYMRLHWEDAEAGGYYERILEVVNTALSAPARNCDIYPKRDDAGEAWNKTLDERTRDMVQHYPLTAMDMFIDWLLAYAEDGGAS